MGDIKNNNDCGSYVLGSPTVDMLEQMYNESPSVYNLENLGSDSQNAEITPKAEIQILNSVGGSEIPSVAVDNKILKLRTSDIELQSNSASNFSEFSEGGNINKETSTPSEIQPLIELQLIKTNDVNSLDSDSHHTEIIKEFEEPDSDSHHKEIIQEFEEPDSDSHHKEIIKEFEEPDSLENSQLLEWEEEESAMSMNELKVQSGTIESKISDNRNDQMLVNEDTARTSNEVISCSSSISITNSDYQKEKIIE